MTGAPSINTSERPLTRNILDAIWFYFGGRRTLYVLASVLILGSIALNRGWLAAAAIASILITSLPRAVVCALGLCMHKMAGAEKAGHHRGASCSARASSSETRIPRSIDIADLYDPVSQAKLQAATTIASVRQDRIHYFEAHANRDVFEADPEIFLAGSQVVGQQIGSSDRQHLSGNNGMGAIDNALRAPPLNYAIHAEASDQLPTWRQER